MGTPTFVERARTAVAERRWADAADAFRDAEHRSDLEPADLVRCADVLALIGRTEDSIGVRTRAHERFLAVGDLPQAIRCAVWISLEALNVGDRARAAGWHARARRLAGRLDEPGSIAGFVLIPEALGALYAGDADTGGRLFAEALAIGERDPGDPDLSALAALGTGQAMVMSGDGASGFSLFDEAMVAVTAGEVGPIPSGIVYCAVIGYCHLSFELRRAIEWTRALDLWCRGQQALVAFTGQCQAHRAELFRLHGAWDEALEAASAADARLAAGDLGAAFGAPYQQAEVLRLRGRFDEAAALYVRAGESGWDPQPGLALLRLAEGRAGLAQSLIRESVATADPATRWHLLPAAIEIEVGAGDLSAARVLADELASHEARNGSAMLHAIAAFADGQVRLAEGDAAAAFRSLRAARDGWRALGVPYETARCRLLMGRARRALGEDEAAADELEQARAAFAALGAGPATAEAVRELGRAAGAGHVGPLTAREVEVLRLVSTGMTNRAIASRLTLSEKTVDRHLSNIFAKLGLSSRAAATAYAFEHRLV